MKKLGFGLLAFGIIGMILICVISTKLYGRVYMFDGYAMTSALWILCFAFVGLGIFILMIPLYNKHPKLCGILALLIFVALIAALFIMCGDIGKAVPELMTAPAPLAAATEFFSTKFVQNAAVGVKINFGMEICL